MLARVVKIKTYHLLKLGSDAYRCWRIGRDTRLISRFYKMAVIKAYFDKPLDSERFCGELFCRRDLI